MGKVIRLSRNDVLSRKNRILRFFGIYDDGDRYVFNSWGIGAWIRWNFSSLAYRYIHRFGTEEQQESLSLWWDYEDLGGYTEKERAYGYTPGKVGFVASLAAGRLV